MIRVILFKHLLSFEKAGHHKTYPFSNSMERKFQVLKPRCKRVQLQLRTTGYPEDPEIIYHEVSALWTPRKRQHGDNRIECVVDKTP